MDRSGRLAAAKKRYTAIRERGVSDYLEQAEAPLSAQGRAQKGKALVPQVKQILSQLDDQGRWLTRKDRYKKSIPGKRWNGEYEEQDRISSAVFSRNVRVLCEYLELVDR